MTIFFEFRIFRVFLVVLSNAIQKSQFSCSFNKNIVFQIMSATEVAEHYNKVRQTGIVDRKDSRIFFMRNMNNWIKSQLISKLLLKCKMFQKQFFYVRRCHGSPD